MSVADDGLPTISPEQEALIHRMCALDPARAGGWYVLTVRIEPGRVEARYRLVDGTREQTLLVVPLSEQVDGPHVCTRKFRIVPVGAVDPAVHTLATAVARQVVRLESRFEWSIAPNENERSDIEVYAVLDDVKPALRRSASPEQIGAVEAKLQAAGLVTMRMPRPCMLGGQPVSLVFAARDTTRAAAPMELERRALDAATADDRARANRELGLALGYPDCCVTAFCARLDRTTSDGNLAEQYVAACDAWVPAPSPLLNNLVSTESLGYFSGEPCRYDCAQAQEHARAVREALARRSARSAAKQDRLLERPVAITATNERFHIELSAGPDLAIVRAVPLPPGRGLSPSPAALEAARSLGGAPVDKNGWVVRSGQPPCRVFDFSSAAASTLDAR